MAMRAFVRRPAVVLVLALCAVGAGVTLLGRLAGGPRGEEKRLRVSGEGFTEAWPAFSPDGRSLAFSAHGSDPAEAFHIAVRPAGGGALRLLTSGAASDIGPVFSPDGAVLAFLRMEKGAGSCMTVAAAGGNERRIAECGPAQGAARPLPAVAWMRDGRSLLAVRVEGGQPPALFTVPLADGPTRRLTTPPEGSGGDGMPALSPKGDQVAFVRAGTGEGADVYLCDLAGGGPRRLTFEDLPVRGVAWSLNGREILYAASRLGRWGAWRIPAGGGSPREVVIAGQHAQFPAVAGTGYRLAYTESPSVTAVWEARSSAPGSTPRDRPLVRSRGREFAPAYSPDGTRIANISDQTGTDQIWVSDADGGNRVQLTNLKDQRLWPPRWSPDGTLLLFESRGEHGSEIQTVRVSATGPVEATRVLLGSAAAWSSDGRAIYYQSRGQIWKATADGGSPQRVETQDDAGSPQESPDGKYVYYRHGAGIWRMPAAGGKPEEAVAPSGHPLIFAGMQTARQGVYYLEFTFAERGVGVAFWDAATRKSRQVFHLTNADFGPRLGFSVSPDGASVLYPRVDQSRTELMVVENFR